MLNWLARYAPAGADLLDEDGRLRGSLLDVGCGPHGFACAHPGVPFVGLDVEFPVPVARSMVAVQAEPGRLPFADASFDTVLSLDTLEHVPAADRAGFVAELGRAAARCVLIACPSSDGARLDAIVRHRYEAAGVEVPAWLSEHDEHGLPFPEDIAAWCADVPGFSARPWSMVNGLMASLTSFGDLFELAADAHGESVHERENWIRLLETARFGASFRAGWELVRDEPAEPAIGLADLAGDTARALECRACGAGHEPGSHGGLRCRGCGVAVPRTAHGAWALPEPAPAPVRLAPEPQAPAPVAPVVVPRSAGASGGAPQLLLAPDWERPSTWLPTLAAYMRAARPGSGAALHLEAATSDLGLGFVAALMEHACERLAGDAPFADVVIVPPGDAAPAGARPIAGVAGVHAAFGVRPAASPAAGLDAAAIVGRARWGKALHDELRAIGERVRFDATPDPWGDREPLVSVRIPTWNGIEKLLRRSIPSVVNGSYGNVEVVVCSDGPDEACRTAVQALGHPAVRFLELPERPRYASHYWSFWETAGIAAVNHALDHARGSWIAPLDHDDAFTVDHLQVLLAAAMEHQLDLAYGQALCETAAGAPHLVGSSPLGHGHIAHGSAIYGPRLRHFRLDPHSWLLEEPGDWNVWRRMMACEARIGHLSRVVLAHGRERTSIEADERVGDAELAGQVARTARDHAEDVLGTDAVLYLEIAPLAGALAADAAA